MTVPRASLHAIERARQRYGIELTPHVVHYLVRRIRVGDAALVERRRIHSHVATWDVPFNDQTTIRCVYDDRTRTIITVIARPAGLVSALRSWIKRRQR